MLTNTPLIWFFENRDDDQTVLDVAKALIEFSESGGYKYEKLDLDSFVDEYYDDFIKHLKDNIIEYIADGEFDKTIRLETVMSVFTYQIVDQYIDELHNFVALSELE